MLFKHWHGIFFPKMTDTVCAGKDEDDGPAEPTLFSLITSKSGTVPPALWHERDLVGTLEDRDSKCSKG